jgi:hypothetical protein
MVGVEERLGCGNRIDPAPDHHLRYQWVPPDRIRQITRYNNVLRLNPSLQDNPNLSSQPQAT